MQINKMLYAHFIRKCVTKTPFYMGVSFFPKVIHIDEGTKIFCQIEGQ